MRDHLGNVRMVLTDEQQTNAYPAASMEDVSDPNNGEDPDNYINFYASTNYTENPSWRYAIADIPGYPADNYTSPNNYVVRLNAALQKVGPSMTLKVMAGDKVNLRVNAWYNADGTPPDAPEESFLEPLLDAMNNGIGSVVGSKASTQQLQSSGILDKGIQSFLNIQTDQTDDSRPRAYLNWVLFDEQFNFVEGSSGAWQVEETQDLQTYVLNEHPLDKSGYLYVYVSNETPNLDVFFDNLQVTHTRGPLLEETHYYPFGLTMAGISSKAAGSLENRKKFNGGTELNNDFNINLYETTFRGLDPQLGRFWQQDPMGDEFESVSLYAFANNNPILFNDPSGLASDSTVVPDAENGGKVKELENVTVVSPSKKAGNNISGPYLNISGPYLAYGSFAPALPLGGIGAGVGTGVGTATGVGAAVVATVIIDELARRATPKRWYITYYKRGRYNPSQIYVGRCSGTGETAEEVLRKYDKSHRMNGSFGNAILDQSVNGSVFVNPNAQGLGAFATAEVSGYAITRGREQQLYDDFKLKGYSMGNSINPVWKYNPLAYTYWTASTIAFGPLQPYGATY